MADVLDSIKKSHLPAALPSSQVLDGKALKDLLRAREVFRSDGASLALEARIDGFLKDGPVTVSALYVADPEPLLLAFEIDTSSRDQNNNPVLADLTGDTDLDALFQLPVTSASARVFRVSKSSVKFLRRYGRGQASPNANKSR
jgi:hypothetical protein